MNDHREPARDKFIALRESLQLMPWPDNKDDVIRRDPLWDAKYRRLVVVIGLCFAEDVNRAAAICGEFVPQNCRGIYERFLTGKSIDTTSPQLRAEILKTHNPVILNYASQIVDATVKGDGRIFAHVYQQIENQTVLTRYWERTSHWFRDQKEFDARILQMRKADPAIVVTVTPSAEYKLAPKRPSGVGWGLGMKPEIGS